MKKKRLLFGAALFLFLGSNATLHAQNHESEINLETCTPHDANWAATDNGYRMSWYYLGAKLSLTNTYSTLYLRYDVDFSNYDAVTMHIRYEIDTELADGAELFYVKTELEHYDYYDEQYVNVINLCSVITKSQERTIDVVLNPELFGGLSNIKRIFLQSAHSGDDGGAVYVTDVTFDVHNIVDGVYSDLPAFSTRPYNGDLYLCKDLPIGTFADAVKMQLFINTIYNHRPDGEPACQLWAVIDGGDDVIITLPEGTTKYKTKPGNDVFYLNNIADKSKITGFYLRPMCTQGVCGFNADVSAYDDYNREFYRSTRMKFNARTENAAPIGVLKLFNSDRTPGRFTDADRIRMYFNEFYEAPNLTGARYKVSALLSDDTTPLISIPTSSATDNNEGRCMTLDIPEDIDRSKIVNFLIEPIEGQGELDFTIATYALDIDTKEKGDHFDEWYINPDKSAHITLNKGDAAPYEPIDGDDLQGFLQLTVVATDANCKVSFVPEFLMDDNSVITASNTYTTTGSGTAHFYINEMLTKEQVSQVKNVRLRVVSYDDGNIDFSRIYLADYMTLENHELDGDYWSTYYNGYCNTEADENTTVYTVSVAGSYAKLSEVTDKIIKAGQGVVLKSTAPNSTLTYTAESGTADFTSNQLKGVDIATTPDDYMSANPSVNAIYTLSGGSNDDILGFYPFNGAKLGASKGFLTFDEQVSGIRGFISFDEDADGATSIGKPAVIEKQGDGAVYDLMGRRMDGQQLRRGIYVRNGKKIVY